jgi:hypothetical protein
LRIFKRKKTLKDLLTPLEEAVEIANSRKKDSKLRARVESFLQHDIPTHFKEEEVIFYLARHVATPNYETLHFIEIAKPFNKPIVIGQDSKDKLVSNNAMKRALGKMPVTKGMTSHGDEIIENCTLIDFSKEQGKPFVNIKTKTGKDLMQFHTELFNEIYPTGVLLVDESEWIDRNHRGLLLEHYTKFLSLLLVHGIMIESYIKDDKEFVDTILIPAFERVEKRFDARPLICPLMSENKQYEKNWDAYPSVLYSFIKQEMELLKK